MSLAVRTAEKGEAACFDAVLRFGLGEVVATVGNACSSKETSCILTGQRHRFSPLLFSAVFICRFMSTIGSLHLGGEEGTQPGGRGHPARGEGERKEMKKEEVSLTTHLPVMCWM